MCDEFFEHQRCCGVPVVIGPRCVAPHVKLRPNCSQISLKLGTESRGPRGRCDVPAHRDSRAVQPQRLPWLIYPYIGVIAGYEQQAIVHMQSVGQLLLDSAHTGAAPSPLFTRNGLTTIAVFRRDLVSDCPHKLQCPVQCLARLFR